MTGDPKKVVRANACFLTKFFLEISAAKEPGGCAFARCHPSANNLQILMIAAEKAAAISLYPSWARPKSSTVKPPTKFAPASPSCLFLVPDSNLAGISCTDVKFQNPH
jgi:hypothetical protein